MSSIHETPELPINSSSSVTFLLALGLILPKV